MNQFQFLRFGVSIVTPAKTLRWIHSWVRFRLSTFPTIKGFSFLNRDFQYSTRHIHLWTWQRKQHYLRKYGLLIDKTLVLHASGFSLLTVRSNLCVEWIIRKPEKGKTNQCWVKHFLKIHFSWRRTHTDIMWAGCLKNDFYWGKEYLRNRIHHECILNKRRNKAKFSEK